MKTYRTVTLILACSLTMISCSHKMSEDSRFGDDVAKDIAFNIDSLNPMGKEWATFSNAKEITYIPDYELPKDGSVWGNHSLFEESAITYRDSLLLRNYFFNDHSHRVVCVDRINSNGKTKGVVYVMQSKSRQYPTYGTYNWDVTDRRNISLLDSILEDYRKQSLKMFADNENNYTSSIHKYNELKSLADSCYFIKNYEGALYYYEQALQYTNCINGIDLYNAACVAALNGNTEQAFIWLRRRMALEPEWYIRDLNRDKDLESLRHTPQWQDFVTDMISRRNATERLYDQDIRNQLLKIGGDDQRIRSQWVVASRQIPVNNQLVDSISTVMYKVDSVNQIKILQDS